MLPLHLSFAPSPTPLGFLCRSYSIVSVLLWFQKKEKKREKVCGGFYSLLYMYIYT